MKIKIKKIKELLAIFILVYILNKALFDLLIGFVAKPLYYVLIFAGACAGIFKMVKGKSKLSKIVIAFFIYSLIVLFNGIVLSNGEQQSVGYTKYITYPLVLFASYYYLRPYDERKDDLLQIISYWGVITSILALIEYVLAKPILKNDAISITRYFDGTASFRARVFCISPMSLAVLLGVSAIICLYFFYKTEEKKNIWFFFICLIGIFCTGSRGPLIATIIGILFMYRLMYKGERIARKHAIMIFGIGTITILFITILIAFPTLSTGIAGVDAVLNRFTSTFNFKDEWGNLERLRRWAYYLNVFKNHWLYGIGIAQTSAEVTTNNLSLISNGITTESGILARLVETGIIGTFAYYVFLLYTFKCTKGQTGSDKSYRLAMIGILVLFLVEDIALQISLDIFCTFILWYTIGLGLPVIKRRKRINTSFHNWAQL